MSATLVFSILISIFGGLTVGVIAFTVYKMFLSATDEKAYAKQLQELSDGMTDEDAIFEGDHGRNIAEKWKIHWQKIGKASGISMYADKNNNAPRDALLLGVAGFVLGAVFTKNPVIGLATGPGLVFGLNVLLKMRFNKESGVINDQLPGFLFALKANIQANETPVRAMLKIVDNMPDPLRTDLTIVKQKLLANASFAEALEGLAKQTTSSELKFLASCLIQASSSGANIEPQIDTIQNVLEQRKAAADELRKAVRATLPSIYIGSFAIPVSLVAAYILDPTAKDFWFKTPLSFAALVVVGGLYGFGMWLSRKMVENIRNL